MSKKCEWCNINFIDTTSNKNKICCSKVCVNKLWYLKNKEKEQAKYKEKAHLISEINKAKRIYAKKVKCKKEKCFTLIRSDNTHGYCRKHRPNLWYFNNKTRRKEYDKKYASLNREKINKNTRDRLKNDVLFKLASSLRGRLNQALKNNQKTGSAVRDLGCSVPELKQHLEAKFKPGMTWDNWSLHGWHIDHIKPLSKFDLYNKDEFKKACHYTNLQPLWASENYSKGNKYE